MAAATACVCHKFAVNVAYGIIVMAAITPDFNTNRLDLYIASCHSGGVRPVICINKIDLAIESDVRQIMATYELLGYQVLYTSACTGQGLDGLRSLLKGNVSALVGSSGVGKYSLIKNDVQDSFPDIEQASHRCRFRNCTHIHEPACEVKRLVDSGAIACEPLTVSVDWDILSLPMRSINGGGGGMNKFISLPVNKRDAVINAGLKAFGKSGYRKCSVSDIAAFAGIAKSMVFHYFGTKRDMYFYLIQFVRDTIVTEFTSMSIDAECDFFERIRLGTMVKVAVLKRYPHATSFVKSFCFETDSEVSDDVKVWLAQGFDFSSSYALRNIDMDKFKPGVEPGLVVRMLHIYSEGFMSKAQYQPYLDIDAITTEFYQCLHMLRQNLYREEFL